jgi:hypothetical protein
MSRFQNVHWLAPTTMLGSLILGLGFAIGHHGFYNSLQGNPIPTNSYRLIGQDFSKQQINIFVGNAFAFAAKIFFTLSITSAYIQLFWRYMKSVKQSPTLTELDWASSGLDNVLSLLNVKLGRRYPFLVLLAISFWYVKPRRDIRSK